MALVEAAASGLPMICRELGTGTSFVNQHGVTGFVVPPPIPARSLTRCRRCGAIRPAPPTCGAAARRRYEQLFTAEAMGAAYAELYRQLATRQQANPGRWSGLVA